ncbi:MAG: T9SS type A sorting domain-containing protein [Bacteroidota bacterium]
MKTFKYVIFSIALILTITGKLTGQETHLRLMNTVYPLNARTHDSILALKVPLLEFPQKFHSSQIPAMVDNSKNNYWPGIQDQFLFMSCQQYSGVAYVFGYEINRMRNKIGWYWDNSYPAHYTWNFMNQGEQFGVNFLQSFEVIKQQGHMTSNDYGIDTATSVLGWISGYDKYYRGMFNHLKQVYAIQVNNAEGINMLRNYLYDHLDGSPAGGIACFTTSSGTLFNLPKLPPGTTESGKSVILSWLSDPVHGMTVVGYNDSIRYDVNHDGKFTNNMDITGDGIVDARDWEIGGFRIANSYGGWWEDYGYVYALYRSFALNYGEGGVWNNRVFVVEADTTYQPELTVKVNLNYSARSKIRMLAGVSADTLHQMPDHVIDFPIFNFQGGEHSMQGYDTMPASKSIEFGLDVTALLNFVPSGQPARFFLMVEEHDPDHIGIGKIEHVSFISYHNGTREIPVNGENVVIKDNNTTLVSVVAAFEKPNVQITTTSLPPFSAAQPVQTQLEASGGQPPYNWSLTKEYVKNVTNTPEPLISGTSIQVHYETKSFASVALPFSFPFYGKRFDSIYVNYFGFIAFEPQNLPGPFITDEMGMLRTYPLIIPSFSQQYTYQANKNDGIWFQADASHAVIRWKTSVSRYVTTSTDDFAVILYPDGRFEFSYGTMDNQGFVHTFYKGVSQGNDLTFDIQNQWNANEIAGKSWIYYPPAVPAGLTLSQAGVLSVTQADSSLMYGLNIRVADAGKFTNSKTLMLSSGLGIVHDLICGTDARLKSGQQASLKLVLTNNGTQAIQNLTLRLRKTDTLVQITDSVYLLPLLNPGQSLTIPTAFSFRLRHPLPNDFPVMMLLHAQSATRSWGKELLFPVAAPDMIIESTHIADGYNDRLDPGEVADLVVDVKNAGALMARNLQLKLTSASSDITILSASTLSVDQFDILSSKSFQFQLKASQLTQPGSDVPMQIIMSDSTGVLQIIDFTLIVGTKGVALVNLATSQASALAMISALNSLNVGYDYIDALPFDYNRYASVFLILGTSSTGTYPLSDNECSSLAAYLQLGGKLYMEGYYTWYYLNKTILHPMFKYTSKKVPAYYYPDVKGIQGTFTGTMNYVYTAPMSYAVFNLEPVAPAYATLNNKDNPAKNLEIVYDGTDYKTIASMLDFSALDGGLPPSTQTTLMQRYLEFFDLNITGPFPLFHAGSTYVCQNQSTTFTDDSFNNITTRNWEFPGGSPATSTDPNPVVRYDAPGLYDVKLTVSDGVTSKTILKQQYIHVDHCSGTAEQATASTLFRIFPNPATDQVTIVLNRNVSGICTIQLYDLAGSMVKNFSQHIPSGNQINLNLSGLGKGLYFLKVQAGELNSTLKVIKN